MYFRLILGIKACGSFVEKYDWGILQQGASNGNALPLATRKGFAVFADDGIVALRHSANEVVALRQSGGVAHFLVGSVALADSDIVGNRGIEQQYVLKDDGIVFQQRFGVNLRDVVSAHKNLSVVDVPKACGELGSSAFAPTRRPYEGGNGALACRERDIVQHLLRGFVGKTYVAELNVVVIELYSCTSLLRGHAFYFLHTVDAHVEEGEQGKVVAHFDNGIVDHCRCQEVSQVGEYRHFALLQQPRSHQYNGGHAELEQHSGEVEEDSCHEFAAHKLVFVALQPLVEAAAVCLFATVRPYFLHTFKPFLYLFGYATLHFIVLDEGFVELTARQQQCGYGERNDPKEG